MFLALTSDHSYWDTSEKVVFLSDSCRLKDSRRSHWQALNYEVMPNLWQDPVNLREAIEYVDSCVERMLCRIGTHISDLHGQSYNERHWRILLYPWLQRYTHVLYDRYRHIQAAVTKYPNLTTSVVPQKHYAQNHDLAEHVHHVREDWYNHQICSQILTAEPLDVRKGGNNKNLSGIHTPTLETWPASELADKVLIYKLSYRHNDMLSELGERLSDLLCDYPDSFWDRKNLPMPKLDVGAPRSQLSQLPASDEFESILVQTLPQNFPTLYLEGYKECVNLVRQTFKSFPRLIISSAHGWYTNEMFKYYAAISSDHGTRIASMQAGGANGTYLYFAQQAHEERMSDVEFVWGWAEDNKSKLRNTPCFYTTSIIEKSDGNVKRCTGSKVLFMQAGPLERYLRWMYSTPYGGGAGQQYIDWQIRFFDTLPDDIRKNFLYRAKKQRDDGQHFVGQIVEAFPELTLEDNQVIPGSERILSQDVRLVVIDHCSTGYLEAFAANKPTLLYWNPDSWLMNEHANIYFDKLRSAGILFDTPEEAADAITHRYEDPLEWWSQDNVQKIRAEVLNKYGWGTKDWLNKWEEAIRAEFSNASSPSIVNS